MHKRILLVAAALALAAVLSACGQRGTDVPTAAEVTQPSETQQADMRSAEGDIASPQTPPQTDVTQAENTQTDNIQADSTQADNAQTTTAADTAKPDVKTGELFQKYVRDKVADGTYTLRTEQSGMKIVVAVDGDDSAIESDAAGLLRFSLVHRGDDYYMIMHTSKKYTRMTEAEYKKQVNTVGSSGVDLDGMKFRSSGSETVNGKLFSTETYDEGEQGIVTYFFDETGVRRTRVVKDGKTSETDVFVVTEGADDAMFEVPAGYTLVSEPAQLLT